MITPRQKFYLTKVLGFASSKDGKEATFAKADFFRIDATDYVRGFTISFDDLGKITEKKIRYYRDYEDEDPTPVDPFIPAETKEEDKNIMIFIIMVLNSELMKGKSGN